MTQVKVLTSSAIILSGGQSSRFKTNKSIAKLFDKPLINHVIERIKPLVAEVLVVVASVEQQKELKYFIPSQIRIVIDEYSTRSSIVGVTTGLKSARGKIFYPIA